MDICFYPATLFMYALRHSGVQTLCTDILQRFAFAGHYSLATYLVYFAVTYALELPAYWFFLRNDFSFLKIARLTLVVNILTHPIVFWIFPRIALMQQWNTLTYLLAAEFFAFAVEAAALVWLYNVKAPQAIAGALIANIVSWQLGLMILQKIL